MAQRVAPDLWSTSASPSQAGGAVPAFMQLDDGQPGGLREYLGAPADVVGLPRRAIVLAEDQVVVLPGGTGGQPSG